MEELMKEEKEGIKAAEQEKPKKRRNRKKNRKNEMRKSYFAGMISMLALVMIVLVGTTFLWPGSSADHPGGFWSWRKTAAIKAMISQLYAGDVDDTELSNAMYKGMISGLGDKYSTYYTKEEYEAIKTAQEGYYQGIGVTVTLDGDKLQVTGVQDDTPAAKAGIQADDRIVKIDGQTLEGLNLNDAVGLLKNSENDTVTLSIEREGEADLIETEVEKEKLAAIVADGKMLDDKIGYLAISEFTGLTSEQFQKAYQSLQDQGMERLIIDLRGNPGGLVTASVTPCARSCRRDSSCIPRIKMENGKSIPAPAIPRARFHSSCWSMKIRQVRQKSSREQSKITASERLSERRHSEKALSRIHSSSRTAAW